MNLVDIFNDVQGQLYSFAEKLMEGYAQSDTNGKILYQLGSICFGQQKFKEAFEWYKKAAEKGNGRALYRLGDMYEYGYSLMQDDKKAFECYKHASEDFKCPDAMYTLGRIYLEQARAEKFGVDVDREKALELLDDAAFFGSYKANSFLAFHYSQTDSELAYEYAITAYDQIFDDIKPYHFFEHQELNDEYDECDDDNCEDEWFFKNDEFDEMCDLISGLCNGREDEK